jgi:glutamate N-acetyltransferase / amino-acid N-acetyltransferase
MSPFFASRWVAPLDHVTELGSDGDTGLPAGFRAAGVTAGLKPSGAPDVGLIACDSLAVTSHAMFTSSGTQSAPVLLCRERCELGSIAAVVVNSGNANAATGDAGYDDAQAMQELAATATGVHPTRVAVASTGVIGVPLDMGQVVPGIRAAGQALAADGDRDFSEAIQTTDAFEKRARVQVALPSGTVTVTAQAKGAGMISPGFATLLCFVQTDAAMSAQTCELLLTVCVKRSFDRISVDGQLSTSDTVILQASGASGVTVAPESEDELRLGEAIDAIMRQLALLVVKDGEGARRTGRVLVRGGDERTAQRVARSVANSPLVKAALYGTDPNWGRIAQAVGAAMPHMAPLALDISIEGVPVCSAGSFVTHDPYALAAAVAGDEVEYEVQLPGDGAEAEVYFSDLGHEYVTINAEYTT